MRRYEHERCDAPLCFRKEVITAGTSDYVGRCSRLLPDPALNSTIYRVCWLTTYPFHLSPFSHHHLYPPTSHFIMGPPSQPFVGERYVVVVYIHLRVLLPTFDSRMTSQDFVSSRILGSTTAVQSYNILCRNPVDGERVERMWASVRLPGTSSTTHYSHFIRRPTRASSLWQR